MKQATIEYEDDRLVRALAAMGRELGFTVTPPREGVEYVNGIPMEMGDPSVEIEPLDGVFTDTDARKLRETAWKGTR